MVYVFTVPPPPPPPWCSITRCWCERWSDRLWLGRDPPCSSAPGEPSLGPAPRTQARLRCSGTRAGGWMVWRRGSSWSWPLCQRRQSLLRICPTGRGTLREETRNPRGSRPAGRRSEPGRWRRSAPPWRSGSPAARNRPTLGLSIHHLMEDSWV